MILMVTLPIVAHAQDEEYLVNKMPDISMTSPLSSQFNRFEFYPVSKATGVVDISIPLFSIPMPDGGSLPFSIAYHASGIKWRIRWGFSVTGGVCCRDCELHERVSGK